MRERERAGERKKEKRREFHRHTPKMSSSSTSPIPLRILLVGNGGREHTLAWKLAQSARVEVIHVVPGNGGTAG